MEESLQTLFSLGIQVSILALLGIAGLALMRPSSSLARWTTCSIIAVIAILTLSAVFPTPKWSFARVSENQLVEATKKPFNVIGPNTRSVVTSPGGLTAINLNSAFSRVESALQKARMKPPQRSVQPMLILVSVLCGIGLLRFVAAWRYSRGILRNSQPIAAAAFPFALDQLKGKFGQKHVACRESSDVTDAAVVGIFRPAIVLPPQWRTWTQSQLECVIAHRMAHVPQQDSAWRLAACIVETLHFYNPIVRLLTRRFAFLQEIAADNMAAECVGLQRYVQGLSTLALQRDKHTFLHDAGMNPVFSGFLIRRIKMLRNLKNTNSKSEPSWAKYAVAAAVVAFGCLGYVARSVADGPDDPVTRIASRGKNTRSPADPTLGMFQRERSDPNLLPENNDGMVKVRFNDLLDVYDTSPAVGHLNSLVQLGFQNAFGSEEIPTFDASRIELLVGSCQLILGYHPDAENKHSIGLGADSMQVRLNGPLDLKAWVTQYIPGIKDISDGSYQKYEIPKLLALAPAPIPMALKGDRTLCFGGLMPRRISKDSSGPESTLDATVAHRATENASGWADAFRRVDGGIIALVASNQHIDQTGPLELDETITGDERLGNEAYHRIQNAIETVAVGADVSADGSRVGVKIELACDEEAKADSIVNDVRFLIEAGQRSLDETDEQSMKTIVATDFYANLAVAKTAVEGGFAVTLKTSFVKPDISGPQLAAMMVSELGMSSSVEVKAE
ncbi:MAG: M56 family metallopeptidase [Pirellulaceae bacterium]